MNNHVEPGLKYEPQKIHTKRIAKKTVHLVSRHAIKRLGRPHIFTVFNKCKSQASRMVRKSMRKRS